MEKICKVCGQAVGNEDLYCIHCGASLASHKAENEKIKNENEQKEDRPASGSVYAPLSFKDYLFMGLLFCIPVVNLIVLLVWALDKGANLNRRNFAKAGLVYMGIALVLSLIFTIGMFRALVLDAEWQNQRYYHRFEDYPDVDGWMHDMMEDVNET